LTTAKTTTRLIVITEVRIRSSVLEPTELNEFEFRSMSATTKVLEHCQIDLGQQENARVWQELEQDFLLVKQGGETAQSRSKH
jgi:hypothetical protein